MPEQRAPDKPRVPSPRAPRVVAPWRPTALIEPYTVPPPPWPESETDQDYFIDQATIDLLGDGTATDHLLQTLRNALGSGVLSRVVPVCQVPSTS